MKKIFSLLLVTALVFTSIPFSSFASENRFCTSGILEINAEGVTVSGPMTYEEMMARYTENLDGVQWMEQAAPQAAASAPVSYRVLSVPLTVTVDTEVPGNAGIEYIPRLEFYCETSESGNYWGILSIYSIQMNRGYNGISRQFSGDVNVWLRSAYQIEYVVNGDFYNNGTTTVSGNGGFNVSINELIKVNFSASITESSNHFGYCYEGKLVSFQG